MRILYDGFIYRIQRAGGINRYLANIIGGLPSDWTPVLTVRETRQYTFPAHPKLVLKSFPALHLLRPKHFAEWGAKRFFAGIESQRGLDLIHSAYHFSLRENLPAKRRAPFLLTIHDMIPEVFRQEVDPDGCEAGIKRKAVATADAIICDSENTRRDFLERNRFSVDRTFVIPLASELSREMALGDEPVPERPYFIFTGARPIYKNFVRLALAFAQIAEKWPDVELCVIGAPFDMTERGLLDALKIQKRVRNLGHVPDKHLAKLYRCSLALVYPSMYEGFGIPPLEAMSCGTVVIAASVSSLPEVIGDAAIAIDPQSVDSIVEAMLKVRDLEKNEREELIAKGMAQSARFNWNETVRRTIEVYKTITR
jgi:glycosyltransferase involved in cell wall biosynthesis